MKFALKNLQYLLLLFSLLLFMDVEAQYSDSTLTKTDSLRVFYFYSALDSADLPTYTPIDTILAGSEITDPAQKYGLYSTLGNVGLSMQNLVFSTNMNTGFSYGNPSFEAIIQRTENIKFYKSLQPYTNIFYQMGPDKQQLLEITHSQNIFRGITFGIDFALFDSWGNFLQQHSQDHTLTATLRYFTPNRKYGATVAFSNYKMKTQENGGLVSDSAFQAHNETITDMYDIELTDALTEWRSTKLEITQYYDLSRRIKPEEIETPLPKNIDTIQGNDTTLLIQDSTFLTQDSLVIDSLQISISDTSQIDLQPEKRPFNWGRVSWKMEFEKLQHGYYDDSPNTDFYTNWYYSSAKTADTSQIYTFKNRFGYSNANGDGRKNSSQLRYYFYLSTEHTKVGDTNNGSFKAVYNQLIPEAKIATQLFKTFQLRGGASYVIGDYNNQDFALKGEISNRFGKGKRETNAIFLANLTSIQPNWRTHYYNGNNFRWFNNFDKTKTLLTGFHLRNKSIGNIGVNYYLISDYVFYNQQATPQQSTDNISILQAVANNKFHLGRWTIDCRLAWQNVMGTTDIHLPNFVTSTTFYHRIKMFKGALSLQPGIRIYYSTAYYADAYMPATNIFYLQDEIETGDYVYADFFINLKIQRAHIFLKLRHFDQGFFDYKYYQVPHYPMADRGIVFGLKWRFHN